MAEALGSVASRTLVSPSAALNTKKSYILSPPSAGYDPNEIITTFQAINQEKHDAYQTKIDVKKASIESWEKLKVLVETLEKAAASLRKTTSMLETQGDFSKLKGGTLSGSTEAVYLDVGKEASPQTIPIEVIRLALPDMVHATAGISDPKAALGVTGALYLQGESVALNSTMNLIDIVDSINSRSSITKVHASITKIDQEYFLSYSSQETGKPIVTDSTGVSLNGAVNFLPPTSSKSVEDLSAQVKMRGFDTVLHYPTNTITDQGEGLTFVLRQEGSAVLQVENDIEAAGKGIIDFVNAYNEVYQYVREEKEFSSIRHGLLSALGDSVRGVRGAVKDASSSVQDFESLAEIGLTLKDGQLSYDSNVWVKNLQTSFDKMVRAFDFSMLSSDSRVRIVERPPTIHPSLVGKDIIIAKTMVDQTLTATALIDGQVYALKVDPNDPTHLKGEDNTPLKGFTFNSTAEPGTSATVWFSQGIADQLKQNLGRFLNSENGILKDTQARLHRQEEQLIKKLEEFDKRAEADIAKQKEKLVKVIESLNQLEKLKAYFAHLYAQG